MEDGGWRMEDGGWRMEDGGSWFSIWFTSILDPRSSIFSLSPCLLVSLSPCLLVFSFPNTPISNRASAFLPSAATVTACPRFSSMQTTNFWLTGLSSARRIRRLRPVRRAGAVQNQTRRQGDRETGRQGEKKRRKCRPLWQPLLLVSLSPCLLVSLSSRCLDRPGAEQWHPTTRTA